MRAGAQRVRAVDRLQCRRRRPVRTIASAGRAAMTRPMKSFRADIMRRDAQIVRGGLPVDLVGRDVALLDAHHAERLGAIGRDAERFPGRHDGADDRIAVARRHRQLIGEFARRRRGGTAAR